MTVDFMALTPVLSSKFQARNSKTRALFHDDSQPHPRLALGMGVQCDDRAGPWSNTPDNQSRGQFANR